MSDGLDPWIVLYRAKDTPCFTGPPEGFACRAEDGDHAEEQCRNSYPDCEILWTWLGDSEGAYADFYGYERGTDSTHQEKRGE